MIEWSLASSLVPMSQSLMGRLYRHFGGGPASTEKRLLLIAGLAVASHLVVSGIRRLSEWIVIKIRTHRSPFGIGIRQPKVITVHRLIVSAIIFAVYFFALGLILQELGVNLAAYLASASVIGLAISFGSQSFVQDIVVGLTLIFSDAMDVGDLVEIAGAATVVGRVENIGLRFTELTNFFNQRVLIPNRTIANVSRFPNGAVDAFADVWLPPKADPAQVQGLIRGMAEGFRSQFDHIILDRPQISDPQIAPGGNWKFLRVHFRIWPGQGALIETAFRQQVVLAMKGLDPAYSDWQIPVTYRAGP